MGNFTVLLDAPTTAAAQLQIAKIGKFKDARYGDFSITPEEVSSWNKNLEHLPGGKALIDFDHYSDKESSVRDTKAAGWITNVFLDGEIPKAQVEWTPQGEESIKNKEYLFFSPAYGDFQDESGNEYHDVLSGGALTNKPFLNMASVTLASDDAIKRGMLMQASDSDLKIILENIVLDVSQDERDKAKSNNNSLPDGSYPINNTKQLKAAAVLAASHHGDWKAAQSLIRRRAKELGVDVTTLPGFGKTLDKSSSDTRTQMNVTADTLKTLGIEDEATVKVILDLAGADEADTAKVIEAIVAATPKEEVAPAPTKTLEAQAKLEGKVVLDAADVSQLIADASAGASAKKELEASKFDTAFDEAIRNGQASPSQREQYSRFYTLDADNTLEALKSAPKIVNVKPAGKSENPEDAPAGVHESSFQLDQKVQAYMREHELPQSKYLEALDAVGAAA